ncbi:ABZJ_00895 family protein [Maritimibacter alexandrii]|uniref:ABZJ_00895 family protein n=1 Tax=Maritimibacter alexandrii TaxID=2570355 RepID=UPI0011081C9C|nr:ABZJ_00895 family protein [Maritimibacter alexandrii]
MTINIGRYTGLFTVFTVAIFFLPVLLGMPSATGFAIALPPLIAAVVEGNAFAKANGARPAGRTAMEGSLRMTAFSFGVSLLLFSLGNVATGGQLFAELGGAPRVALGAVALVVIQFAFNRLGLRLAPQSA